MASWIVVKIFLLHCRTIKKKSTQNLSSIIINYWSCKVKTPWQGKNNFFQRHKSQKSKGKSETFLLLLVDDAEKEINFWLSTSWKIWWKRKLLTRSFHNWCKRFYDKGDVEKSTKGDEKKRDNDERVMNSTQKLECSINFELFLL